LKEKDIEKTLVIIKPDGIEKRLVGKVIARVEDFGLTIKRIQMRKLSREECRKLYPHTRQNLPAIYASVEKYMTENSSIIFMAEGKDAIEKVRTIRGPTNLLQAPKGTIRRDFITDEERQLFRQGKNVKNVMHASDDKEEAKFEIELFFGKRVKLNESRCKLDFFYIQSWKARNYFVSMEI